MDTAWALAEAWFGDCFKPGWGWQRHQRATSLFNQLGLTGDFWQLNTTK